MIETIKYNSAIWPNKHNWQCKPWKWYESKLYLILLFASSVRFAAITLLAPNNLLGHPQSQSHSPQLPMRLILPVYLISRPESFSFVYFLNSITDDDNKMPLVTGMNVGWYGHPAKRVEQSTDMSNARIQNPALQSVLSTDSHYPCTHGSDALTRIIQMSNPQEESNGLRPSVHTVLQGGKYTICPSSSSGPNWMFLVTGWDCLAWTVS